MRESPHPHPKNFISSIFVDTLIINKYLHKIKYKIQSSRIIDNYKFTLRAGRQRERYLPYHFLIFILMTQLTYLSDTYLLRSPAKILDIQIVEEKIAIILDETIFYPQGGGQPSDTGNIESPTGTFEVEKVKLSPEGIVLHFGNYTKGSLEIGDEVILKVNEAKRLSHAKIHSAGHFIDVGVNALYPDLKPGKGYHFPEGPYVEYEGNTSNINPEIVKINLQEYMNELSKNHSEIIAEDLSDEGAQERGITPPVGKKARIISIGKLHSCGCGGTHVKNTSEIGSITIRKISVKNGCLRVAYEI